jgi:L-lactate dehydrogenase complex protein LldG
MSEAAREDILAKIKGALKRDEQPDSPRGAQWHGSNARGESEPAADRSPRQSEELAKRFELELIKVGGHFHIARTFDSACDYVEGLASKRRARSVVSWGAPAIDEARLAARLEVAGVEVTADDGSLSDEEFIGKAIEAGVGITGADYALADTGTLVLLAGERRARSVSLVPPVHVAILKPRQIVSGLNDLIPFLNGAAQAGRDFTSAVTFITGPSRTADIELTLVIGVHGPQELHVILLDPARPNS